MQTNGSQSERRIGAANALERADELLDAIQREHPLIDSARAKIWAAQDDDVETAAKLQKACCYLGSAVGLDRADAARRNEAAQLLVAELEGER